MRLASLALLATVLLASVGCAGNLQSNGCGCNHGGMGGLAGHGGGAGGPAHVGHLPRGYMQQTQPAGPPTAAYAYPYYSLRGPRDFLLDNPPSIGP